MHSCLVVGCLYCVEFTGKYMSEVPRSFDVDFIYIALNLSPDKRDAHPSQFHRKFNLRETACMVTRCKSSCMFIRFKNLAKQFEQIQSLRMWTVK
jgi:hypothetical protein